jgi:transposase-like protein
MAPTITLPSLGRTITTEASAYAYLIGCANGTSRKTRSGSMSKRRVWKCRSCKRQFSVLTGTITHGTKIPVRNWCMVLFEMCASKNGVAAREIERKYGMCPRSAWFMLSRIRAAMANDNSLLDSMVGTIVADETWIGGRDRNKHASKRGPVRIVAGHSENNPGKVPVLSIINTHTHQVRSVVVSDVQGPTLSKHIANQVNMGISVLHTDPVEVLHADRPAVHGPPVREPLDRRVRTRQRDHEPG